MEIPSPTGGSPDRGFGGFPRWVSPDGFPPMGFPRWASPD